MKIGDKVIIKKNKQIHPRWHRTKGQITKIIDIIKPELYEVLFNEHLSLLFKEDEMTLVVK